MEILMKIFRERERERNIVFFEKDIVEKKLF